MASTVTVTITEIGSIRLYQLDWTAHTDGTISNVLQDSKGNDIKFNGLLMRVTIVPDAGGTQPDDNYVLTLSDENSVDVLADQGAALDEATTTDFAPATTATDGTYSAPALFPIVGELTLAGSGAGDSNAGNVYLYVSR